MRNIIYENKMNITNYIAAIENIVHGYFDEEETYQPEYGLINAMRVFYNLCVTGGKFEEKFAHDITNVLDVGEIAGDDDFCAVFNEAIKTTDYAINFGNAFNTAMDIVDYKKSSLGAALDSIKKIALSFLQNLSGVLTEDNLKQLSEIGKNVASGKINTDAIIDVYKNKLQKQDEKQ